MSVEKDDRRMIGSKTPAVETFWRTLKEAKGITTEEYRVSSFADPRLSQNVDRISDLALKGSKRATAHLEQDFVRNGVPRRKPGDHWVVVNSMAEPICLVRVTKVDILPFDQVGEDVAIAEGEGDLSVEYWRTVHRRYFVKQCELWGISWQEDLPTVCEHFELLWPDVD